MRYLLPARSGDGCSELLGGRGVNSEPRIDLGLPINRVVHYYLSLQRCVNCGFGLLEKAVGFF